MRLFRCRVEGPQQWLPSNYQGLIYLEGSGKVDQARICAINESIITLPT